MALGYCSKCGGQVSDKALSCPHCGAPGPAAQPADAPAAAKKGKNIPLIIALAAVAVVGIVLAVILLTRDSGGIKKAGNDGSPVNSTIVFDNGQSAQEKNITAQEKNVTFRIEVQKNKALAKYLVDFYIDDEFIATIDQDNIYETTFRIKQGIHTVTFKNNEEPDNDAYTLTLNETVKTDETIFYSLKRNTEKGGLFDGIKGIELRDRQYS